MAIFRSSLNSKASANVAVSALSKQISTCFQNWHRNTKESEKEVPHGLNSHLKSDKKSYFVDKAHQKYQNLQKAVKKFFEAARKPKETEPREVEGGVHFVRHFLASAVITQTTNYTTTSTTRTVINAAEKEQRGAEMTYIDEFMQVRDEYPELDKVVRAILLTTAKEKGMTIAEIKNDYLKMEGHKFPVYDNIISYLLSIPKVTAFCNNQGTLYFSIIPNEKTQHLHKLIAESKKPIGHSGSIKCTPVHCWNTSYNIESAKNVARNMRGWRPMHIRTLSQMSPEGPADCDRERDEVVSVAKKMRKEDTQTPVTENYRPAHHHFPPIITALEVVHPESAEGKNNDENNNENNVCKNIDENNNQNNEYYRDNCHYLFGRIYNRQNTPRVVTIDRNTKIPEENAPRHNVPILNRAPTPGKQYQLQQQSSELKELPQRQRYNYVLPMRQPYHKVSSIVSPRNLTSSCEINDTMFENSDDEAHLLDFTLMGDDFLLHLARNELGCRFSKNKKVLQSGFCVSGQTIRQAIRKVRQLPDSNKRFIINLGSVDIMHGRPLVQIQHDFRQLINIMHRKGFQLILTTLAPLANHSYPYVKNLIQRFNEFIKHEGQFLTVIDIWSRFVDNHNRVLFDCYQLESRFVTGTIQPHIFWNKIGRQRVLRLMEENIEY